MIPFTFNNELLRECKGLSKEQMSAYVREFIDKLTSEMVKITQICEVTAENVHRFEIRYRLNDFSQELWKDGEIIAKLNIKQISDEKGLRHIFEAAFYGRREDSEKIVAKLKEVYGKDQEIYDNL